MTASTAKGLLGNGLDHLVVLTHRSGAEFLQKEEIRQRIKDHLKDFDTVDAIIQSFLGQIKSISLKPFNFNLGNAYVQGTLRS
jgi:hypothetical protein